MATELFEPGEYEGTVESGVYKEGITNATPYIEVIFDIGGHKRSVYLYLSEKAENMSIERLQALGWNGEFENINFANKGPHLITCTHAPHYKNKERIVEKWTFWGPKKEYQVNKEFASSIKAKFKASAPSPVTRPVGKPPVPPPANKTQPSAPSSAPPRQKVEAIAKTEQEAWDYWCKKQSDEEKRNQMWTETLSNYGDVLTPEQWNKVALAADIPF